MAMPRFEAGHRSSLSVDLERAAGDLLQPGDRTQKRRLAAAEADEDDELARGNIQIDTVKDLLRAVGSSPF